MRKQRLHILASLIVAAACVLPMAGALAQTDRPRLTVPIPTVNFSGIKVSETDGARTIDVPWLMEYISGVYRYALGVAVLLASVMFIVGGFQYLTAGGDASRVGAAKKRLSDAMIGLLLLLGSYAILNVINPALTSYESIRIRTVKPIAFASNETSPNDVVKSPSSTATGPIPNADGIVATVTHIEQCGSAYGDIPYNDAGDRCTNFTICSSGCGIASGAMVIAALTGQTPSVALVTELAEASRAGGHRICRSIANAPQCSANSCNGTGGGFFVDGSILGKYGLAGSVISGRENITEHLRNGRPIIAGVGPGIFTSGGHIIVLTGINEDGSIRVADPGRGANYPYDCANRKPGHACDDADKLDPAIPTQAVPADYVFTALKGAWYIYPKKP